MQHNSTVMIKTPGNQSKTHKVSSASYRCARVGQTLHAQFSTKADQVDAQDAQMYGKHQTYMEAPRQHGAARLRHEPWAQLVPPMHRARRPGWHRASSARWHCVSSSAGPCVSSHSTAAPRARALSSTLQTQQQEIEIAILCKSESAHLIR